MKGSKEKGTNVCRSESRQDTSELTTQEADRKDKSKETEDVGERTVGGRQLDVLELSPRGCKWCRRTQRRGTWHWGQGGTYPGGTLKIHWGFLGNLSTHYPGGTCWTLLKCTPHFDHNVTCDHMLVTFEMSPPKYPLGTFWMKTPGSFTILFAMCPPWVWTTH